MKLRPSYTPLKITMIKRNVTRAELLEKTGIAPNTYTKINKNEWIALDKIAQICEFLDCRIEDVVEFVDPTTLEYRLRGLSEDQIRKLSEDARRLNPKYSNDNS